MKLRGKIATGLLAMGIMAGGTAYASEAGLFDALAQKAIATYVSKMDTEVAAYSNEQNNSIPGYMASVKGWFDGYIEDTYQAEVKRAKDEIKKHADSQKAYYDSEMRKAGSQVTGAIHSRADELIQQNNNAIDKVLADEAAKYNK
jgi:hypothetical protein